MSRRTLLLIVSILVAAAGTALVGLYVRGADSRAVADQQLVTVVVASKQIANGTSTTAALRALSFAQTTAPRSMFQPGMYTGPNAYDTFAKQMAGSFTATEILPGQLIQPAMFRTTSQATQSDVTPGKVGVSVELTDSQRAASLLKPGTDVTLFVTSTTSHETRIMLPSVRVIGVGDDLANAASTQSATTSKTSGGQSATVAPTIVTLDLYPDQATKVITAINTGQPLYFGILNPSAPS